MKALLALLLLVSCSALPVKRRNASIPEVMKGMYLNTFGDPENIPVIFVHGGPGFNSSDFESTTAERLAKKGYYVIVYDQRGQGRSVKTEDRNFTYSRYSDDIMAIITRMKLGRPVLIGHSHGGPISIKFEEKYPSVARAVILVSAPVNFWDSIKTLYENCARKYRSRPGNEKYLADLSRSFEALAARRKGARENVGAVAGLFGHALIGCRLYQTAKPTEEELFLRKILQANLAPMEQRSMPGFLLNESYVFLSHYSTVAARPGHFFGIYGDEDGLFNPVTLQAVEGAVGSSRFYLIDGASHAVYIDQQKKFLDVVDGILSTLE